MGIPRTIITTLLFWSFTTASFSQCEFSISKDIVCGDELVTFQSADDNGIYGWDFNGDWIIDTYGTEVSHQYSPNSNNVTYNVRLFRNGNFCGTKTIYVLATPDASIGVVPGSGILDSNVIRVCSGSTSAEISIFNASSTLQSNVSYTINWGDGTIETFDNTTFSNTSVITHEYNGYGYYNLRVEAFGTNDCVGVKNYRFYNGSNPSVGLANPGNTVGLCAPATITFPITNFADNTPGTIYNIYVSGELIHTYTQVDIPDSFTYTFEETSCGKTTSTGNYTNAYDVQIEAINPCGSSQATIEPIEISEPPFLDLWTDHPTIACEGDEVIVADGSVYQDVVNGNCSTNLAPSWEILPGASGIDWTLIDGNLFSSDFLKLEFLIPGEYTIRMTVNSEACGEFFIDQTIEIKEAVDTEVNAEVISSASPPIDNCGPSTGQFTNQSTGEDLNFQWTVTPPVGWSYLSGSNANSDNLVISFDDPGTYQVVLMASNDCSVDTWDTTLVIGGPPALTINDQGPFCEVATLNFSPSNVSFEDNGSAFTSYEWQFPGGTPSSSTTQKTSSTFIGVIEGVPPDDVITWSKKAIGVNTISSPSST